VVQGALGLSRKAFGYNPSFLYPKQGGIQVLPAALASRVRNVRCGADVVSVDAERRTVRLRGEASVQYTQLISTLPLPKLVSMTEGLSPWAADASRGLRHVAVINLNLGLDRVVHPDKHWIYFPGKEYVFYRAGFPASFTPAAAPPGCSSIYLEVAARPGEPWDAERLFDQARDGLIRAGILTAADRIVTRAAFYIDPAYVVYDQHRRAALPRLHQELGAKGIRSIGRYGGWYYNSMEDSLADGRSLALEILEPEAARDGAVSGETV
jgi:protoporphyrinogen oxidase